MTPQKHLLHDIQPLIFLSLVTLPNRYKVKVTSFGSLVLSPDNTLTKVMLKPFFQYNINSISSSFST